MEAAADSKRCPKCAEMVQSAATRCRFCSADLRACQFCGASDLKPHVIRSTPGIIVALGIVLIVGGVFGIPFFGLGLIGITLGIVLLAVVRNERKVDLCGACKKVQGGER